MKAMKRIVAIYILFLFTLAAILSCVPGLKQSSELGDTAQHRERPASYTSVIILPNGVALSKSLDNSGFASVVKEINSYRAANGVAPLTWSPDLSDAAAVRAEECSILWSHTRPDGTEYWTVNPDIVYGENLSQGYSTSEVVQAWKDSPTHNENLLYPSYKYIGLAQYGNYISCEFCY